MQRQLTLTRNQLKDLRMSNDTNQAKLIDHSQRQGELGPLNQRVVSIDSIIDQEVVAKLAELDMTVAELEAATSRVATVERRNVCLIFVLALNYVITLSEGNSASGNRSHEE